MSTTAGETGRKPFLKWGCVGCGSVIGIVLLIVIVVAITGTSPENQITETIPTIVQSAHTDTELCSAHEIEFVALAADNMQAALGHVLALGGLADMVGRGETTLDNPDWLHQVAPVTLAIERSAATLRENQAALQTLPKLQKALAEIADLLDELQRTFTFGINSHLAYQYDDALEAFRDSTDLINELKKDSRKLLETMAQTCS